MRAGAAGGKPCAFSLSVRFRHNRRFASVSDNGLIPHGHNVVVSLVGCRQMSVRDGMRRSGPSEILTRVSILPRRAPRTARGGKKSFDQVRCSGFYFALRRRPSLAEFAMPARCCCAHRARGPMPAASGINFWCVADGGWGQGGMVNYFLALGGP